MFCPVIVKFMMVKILTFGIAGVSVLCFFQISKKHDFLRFFEMTYQKVVKSH